MPVIDYRAAIKLLVAVRGHPFDRTAFAALFDGIDGATATMVDQPAAAQLMTPQGLAPYNALVLYDRPGLDCAAETNKPAYIDPSPELRAGLSAALAHGIGIVALHHALAGWPAWPDYGDMLGGRFLYRSGLVHGRHCTDSGYRHDVDYTAEVIAPVHPVTHGLPATFAMRDELYLAQINELDVIPLLRARHDFTAASFHSAAAAMAGRLNDNAGWIRPDGSNLIGWARELDKSRLVYLQPGHDHITYANPHYQRLVENAIRWVAKT